MTIVGKALLFMIPALCMGSGLTTKADNFNKEYLCSSNKKADMNQGSTSAY